MKTLEKVNFEIKTIDNAPEDSKPVLERAQNAYGMIPNLYGVMANHPALVKAYESLAKIFGEDSGFDITEQQVILLTTSYTNNCHYCMAAHSAVSDMNNIPTEITDAIREGKPIPNNDKLEALRQFTAAVAETQGWPSDEDVTKFLDAGYSQNDILGVIVGISFKTMSNYTNHIAQTEVDEPFKGRSWEKN